MFGWWTKRRRERLLREHGLDDARWAALQRRLPLLNLLSEAERDEVRRLSVLIAHEKTYEAVAPLGLDEDMILLIAAQAALPILHLGMDWYQGWSEVLVYPAGFIADRQWADEAGVVHKERQALSGESWQRGPVILAWPEVEHGGAIDGHNLVIHEFAHKLDWLTGAANGLPPLHRGMSPQVWSEAWSAAYADLRHRLEHGQPTPFDAYGATSPAEFFAVFSEVYWETPGLLRRHYPAVFAQLDAFYRPAND